MTEPPAPRLPRAAIVAHVATLVAAFGVWAYLDRHLWFYGDEWDFLTRRGLHGAYFSLWAPHNEHWSVLPILLWRALYSTFHLSTYWPYLIPVLVVHVGIVHLVWRRSLKEGADVWLATALGLLLALFGSGAEDLTWAFQIGFLSSLLLGLLALEVVDRPPRPDRQWPRDVTASALVMAGLMCSTVGLATAVAVGLVLVLRSPWQRAVKVLAVPAAAYLAWFVLAGRSGLHDTGDSLGLRVFVRVPYFVAYNIAHDLGRTAANNWTGPVLALALFGWVAWRWRSLGRDHPALVGCAAAAVVFFALAAVGRDRISTTMSPSRYLYIGTALLLPAIAVALTHLLHLAWSRYTRLLLVGAVVLATLANLGTGVTYASTRTNFVLQLRQQIVTSGALLQDSLQLSRAINRYPVRQSGASAGYLTAPLIAGLYRHKLLPQVQVSSLSLAQVLTDESWLDITGLSRPHYQGRFRVLVVAGFFVELRPPRLPVADDRPAPGPVVVGTGATPTWPTGPGHCMVVSPRPGLDAHGREHRAWVRLGRPRGLARGAVWVSLGGLGGRLYVSLADPWGAHRHLGRHPVGVRGEVLRVSPGGDTWVSDAVPGDGLVLRLARGASAEVCGLAAAPQRGNYITKV